MCIETIRLIKKALTLLGKRFLNFLEFEQKRSGKHQKSTQKLR